MRRSPTRRKLSIQRLEGRRVLAALPAALPELEVVDSQTVQVSSSHVGPIEFPEASYQETSAYGPLASHIDDLAAITKSRFDTLRDQWSLLNSETPTNQIQRTFEPIYYLPESGQYAVPSFASPVFGPELPHTIVTISTSIEILSPASFHHAQEGHHRSTIDFRDRDAGFHQLIHTPTFVSRISYEFVTLRVNGSHEPQSQVGLATSAMTVSASAVRSMTDSVADADEIIVLNSNDGVDANARTVSDGRESVSEIVPVVDNNEEVAGFDDGQESGSFVGIRLVSTEADPVGESATSTYIVAATTDSHGQESDSTLVQQLIRLEQRDAFTMETLETAAGVEAMGSGHMLMVGAGPESVAEIPVWKTIADDVPPPATAWYQSAFAMLDVRRPWRFPAMSMVVLAGYLYSHQSDLRPRFLPLKRIKESLR